MRTGAKRLEGRSFGTGAITRERIGGATGLGSLATAEHVRVDRERYLRVAVAELGHHGDWRW